MNRYELINVNKNANQLPAVKIPVFYRQIDNGHFQFDWNMGDDINASMEESETAYEYSRFSEAEFSDRVPESERQFYYAATASGLLTGCMDFLGITESILEQMDSDKDKSKKLREIIINAARLCGYKKKNYDGAVKYILEKIGAKKLENGLYAELSSIPNATGLAFSLIAQFTGVLYSLNESGSITNRRVPDYYTIGRNNSEKILFGFLYWAFHMALNSIRNGEAQRFFGMPKEIMNLVNALGKTACFRNFKVSDEEIEKKFSNLLKRLFIGKGALDGINVENQFDLERNIAEHIKKLKAQAGSVLLNEGITRALYTLIQLHRALSRENIDSIDSLLEMDYSQLLPANNRIVTNMCVISSGVFMLLNVAGSIGKALIGKKVGGRGFAVNFIANINIVGIGRFIFAIAQDTKYMRENVDILFSKFEGAKSSYVPDLEIDSEEADKVFKTLSLDAKQVRLLLSLENYAVEYDIRSTKKEDVCKRKNAWHQLWKDFIQQMYGTKDENFFIDDDKAVYRSFFDLEQSGKDRTWYYLLTLELAMFNPYEPLGSIEDKQFVKLKKDKDYVSDVFVRRQTIVDEKFITELRKKYDRYTGIVSGSTLAVAAGGAVMVGVAALGGGLALVNASAIAVALAGNSFAGLHGAALVNACLAFFGGGSLAAGGLGMAGGTAAIAGGGALLGLTSSGTVASVAAAIMISDEDRVKYLAKLLTYADVVLKQELHDGKSVETLTKMVQLSIQKCNAQLEDMKTEKNDLNKESIRKLEGLLKCFKNTEKAMKKI